MSAKSKLSTAAILTLIVAGLIGLAAISGIIMGMQEKAAHDKLAALIAKREASMTPAERAARDQARAKAAADATRKAEEERKARALAELPQTARLACMQWTKNNLDDPYSADFGRVSDWPSNVRKDGKAFVLMTFRAKNAFGAYRIVRAICTVARIDDDHVRVDEVTTI
ncbi:MAG: hypothetical protein JSS52_06730 [Proteobacteria bacterium]|nr:hypothetical protein [Pseudomonadota bacterium]